MVIAKIMASFFSEMRANMHSVKAAVELYNHIKELPSTLTISVVQGQAGVSIMGPLSSDKPKLLMGRRPDGTAIVVKLLFADMDDARPLGVRLAEIEQEANCCRDLAFADESIALVPHEVVVLEVSAEFVRQTRRSGTFKALLMPRYVESLAQSGVYPKGLVAREAPRIISALKYMHSQGGEWLLGDFGSACRIGEPIRTSTSVLYHEKMDRDALPKYDWFMLLVMLLIELEDKGKWMFRLKVMNEQFVSYDLVMQHADSAASDEALPPDLRAAIAEVKDLYLLALP